MSRMTRVNLHEATNDAQLHHHVPGQKDLTPKHPSAPELVRGYGAELIEVFDPDAVGGPQTYFYCLYMGEWRHPDLHGEDGLLSDVAVLHKDSGRFEIVARGRGAEALVNLLETCDP